MDKLTSILASLAALSLATERVTETIKGLPGLSKWFAVEKGSGTNTEEFRKASIHIVAIVIGTLLACQAHLATTLGLADQLWSCVLLGAMAAGGAGPWNSALDVVREINKQKQLLTQELKAKALAASPPAPPARP